MFIAALFTIARCPTTDERIQKMWYIYTMEFYSFKRNNDDMWFEGKWMQLEYITLSEVSQALRKTKATCFSLIYGRQIQKINIYTK
jgi:hypothetical protein